MGNIKKTCTFWGQANELRLRSRCLFSSLLLLPYIYVYIYPTASIMTVLLQRSRPWNVLSAVLDQMFRGIYSGLKPFFPERCGRHSDEPEAQSPARRTCLCWDILLSLFSKHHWKNSLRNMVVLVLAVLDFNIKLKLKPVSVRENMAFTIRQRGITCYDQRIRE